MLRQTVKRKLDGPSMDISRVNSLCDDMDYVSEDIPLPVVTDTAQPLRAKRAPQNSQDKAMLQPPLAGCNPPCILVFIFMVP
ncbi:hypothetical protein J4Q44_G00117280 [Coregonus suidteri]|uniref:Uncharacterized protein n=1 Tax=Coregonus suidteri TaxID=861788 RepID=A0AAN8LZR5_9TELE